MNYEMFHIERPDIDVLRTIAMGHPRLIDKDPNAREFLEEMRTYAPKSGDDWVKAVSVVIGKGDQRAEHAHSEHTLLYYIDPVDDCPLIVDGVPVRPKRGDLVLLKPGVMHAVPKNPTTETRISVAMLVTTF